MGLTGGTSWAASSSTARDVRLAARQQRLTSCTAGLGPGYIQANLLILPTRYASDFRLLCQRNPVPCPLLAESFAPGRFDKLRSHMPGVSDDQISVDFDVRHDFPRYFIYKDGQFIQEKLDIEAEWLSNDHVAFLIGCSYSFEAALANAGLPAAHTLSNTIVPMYKTKLSLCPAGIFDQSTFVVSMRPYKKADVQAVRCITRPFATTHGEPVAWGWEGAKRLGISDVLTPDWGDKSQVDWSDPDLVPVFWGCGVTPQQAVMDAQLPGLAISHAPGHMILIDVKDEDIFDLSHQVPSS